LNKNNANRVEEEKIPVTQELAHELVVKCLNFSNILQKILGCCSGYRNFGRIIKMNND
jgi:hypothetical protein